MSAKRQQLTRAVKFPRVTDTYLADHYRFRGDVGEGSFGAVWLYRAKHTSHLVAIKLIHTASKNKKQEAKDEIQMMYLVALYPKCHPNLACLVDNFRIDDQYYIASTYHGERTLFQMANWLRGRGISIAPETLKFVATGLLSGLQYLHRRNLAHMDVKPENIVIDNFAVRNGKFVTTQQSKVVLVDFGIMCMTKTPYKDLPRCAQKRQFGTIIYQSPEIWLNRLKMDGAPKVPYSAKLYKSNDIYSLGLSLFVLCRKEGSVVYSRMANILNGEPRVTPLLVYQLGHRIVSNLTFYQYDTRYEMIIRNMLIQYHKKRPGAGKLLKMFRGTISIPDADHEKPIWDYLPKVQKEMDDFIVDDDTVYYSSGSSKSSSRDKGRQPVARVSNSGYQLSM